MKYRNLDDLTMFERVGALPIQYDNEQKYLLSKDFKDNSIDNPFLIKRIINDNGLTFIPKLSTNTIVNQLKQYMNNYIFERIISYDDAFYVYLDRFLNMFNYSTMYKFKRQVIQQSILNNPEVIVNNVTYNTYDTIRKINPLKLNDFRANSAGFNLLIYQYNPNQFTKQLRTIIGNCSYDMERDLFRELLNRTIQEKILQ